MTAPAVVIQGFALQGGKFAALQSELSPSDPVHSEVARPCKVRHCRINSANGPGVQVGKVGTVELSDCQIHVDGIGVDGASMLERCEVSSAFASGVGADNTDLKNSPSLAARRWASRPEDPLTSSSTTRTVGCGGPFIWKKLKPGRTAGK